MGLIFLKIEVFNLLFVTTQEKKSEVRCLACARRTDASLRSFNVLSEYYMQELAQIYDNFQLQTVGPFVLNLFTGLLAWAACRIHGMVQLCAHSTLHCRLISKLLAHFIPNVPI